MSKSVVGSSKSLKSDAASSKSLVKHEAASSRSLVPSEADSLLASRAMSQFGVSSSLSMRNVQSPDLAAWRTGQVRTMAERGRDAKEKDLQWERSLAAWEAHRQRMEGHNRKLVSARQREVSKRARQKEGQTTEREMTERQALLRALREKHVVDEERATTAAHESSAQRHRRHVEHQEYLARLRRQQREREDAALRAIKAKDEAPQRDGECPTASPATHRPSGPRARCKCSGRSCAPRSATSVMKKHRARVAASEARLGPPKT